jgi:ABC-2 type transport system permease protein
VKRVLYLALKDMRQTLRDRLSFLFLLLMPVIFTLVFSFVFSGHGSAPTQAQLTVLDQDGSPASAALTALLNAQGDLAVTSAADLPQVLQQRVANGQLAAALQIPAGYGASLQAGTPLHLTLWANLSASAGLTAQTAAQTAARRMAGAAWAAAGAANDSAPYATVLEQAVAAWQEPPVASQRISQEGEAQNQTVDSFPVANTAPGMMVQFGIAGLLTSAQVLVNERKSRCMQRLLTTRVARHEILLGHFLAMFAISFVQFVLLVAFAQLTLGLNYLRQPLATLAMIVATALCIAALGVLIGSLAKSDDQAILFALVPMFVFSGLGGAWMPLEYTGKTFQLIGHVTPVAWALDGFKAITLRGLGLESIGGPAAALLSYAALFLALAVWKFRTE